MKRLGIYQGIVYLGVLLVLTPLLVWALALQKTASAYHSCKQIERQLEVFQKKVPTNDSLPFIQEVADAEKEWLLQRVLTLTSRSGGKVEKYTPWVTQREGELTVMTHEFVLQGAYIPLLRVVEGIEREAGGCKPVSLAFRLVRSRRNTESPQLKLTLLIQEITETNRL